MQGRDFKKLLKDVFGYKSRERVTIMYDIPVSYDTKLWQGRRKIAGIWNKKLNELKIKSELAYYKTTLANNADLPGMCILNGKELSIDSLMSKTDIVIALTEFSATAPLHAFAKKYKIRAASMPGFNKKMVPALSVDYNDVAKKVKKIYLLLKKSKSIDIIFNVKKKNYSLFLDLRNRLPRKDDGFCKEPGAVINLPSGEAFIVPFEGKDSKSSGYIPIQKGSSVTIYNVKKNNITNSSNKNDALLKKIRTDPAVGNIAEVAFGVLGFYNIKRCGKILLDEKLGLHIALGRSEHLGGAISPEKFRDRKNIWHQDFVYIKESQPDVHINKVIFNLNNKKRQPVIENGKYSIF